MERTSKKPLTLHPTDRNLLVMLAREGVLGKIEGHRLDPEGMILVVCSEGKISLEISQHKNRCYTEAGVVDPYVQKLALPGGPLLLASSLRAYGQKRGIHEHLIFDEADLAMLHSIGGIQRMNRKLVNVALCAHIPCAWADAVEMDLSYVLHYLMEAREQVKRFFVSRARVSCFLHVDYGNEEGMKTYFVHKDRFRTWARNHPLTS